VLKGKKNRQISLLMFFKGTSACVGDSGGGFVINKDHTWFIRGIVSFGTIKPKNDWREDITCNEMYPSLYTDLASYIEWITQNVPEIGINVLRKIEG
jgi:secreted trypsin-like serine protease